MRTTIWDMVKVLIIFIVCTFIFYFGLRVLHAEYEQYHRYDTPEGPAIKVFNTEDSLLERLNLFFRLGE